MATANTTDQQTFEQWIASLQKLITEEKEDDSLKQRRRRQQPYTILIEYSQSWSLRTSANNNNNNNNDDLTYTRAGLRTPTMNAQRDYWGGPLWVEFLALSLLGSSSSSSRAAAGVDWLVTVPWTAGRRKRLQPHTTSSATTTTTTTTNKIRTIETLEQATAPVLVVEPSLLHDPSKLLLSHTPPLSTPSQILLLPIRTETIIPQQQQQHNLLLLLRQWEDAADALLHVDNGHVTLLRRGGVLQRGEQQPGHRWIRATLSAYRLLDDDDDDNDDTRRIVWDDSTKAAPAATRTTTTTDAATTTTTTRKGTTTPIALEWQDGARQQTKNNNNSKNGKEQPAHIITVDDDDPAFDDYDAEDPDDDLDL